MQTKEFAEYLSGLAKYLAKDAKADIAALRDLLADMPPDTVKGFCGRIQKMLQKEQNSPGKLAARIKAVREGGVQPVDAIRDALGAASGSELKQILKGLGFHAASTATENKRLLNAYVVRGETPPGPKPPPTVDELVAFYHDMKGRARHLDYAQIRSEFERVSTQKARVVKEVAKALGYSPGKSKADNVERLLRPLEKIREMAQRTSVI